MRNLILLFIIAFSLQAQQRGIGLKDSKSVQFEKFYKNSWALIIGIDDYVYAPKLKYAVKDAKAIAEVLIDEYGFERDKVIELYNSKATRIEILKEFDRVKNRAGVDDRVFIFFAGHGITERLPDGRDKGYILPYDGRSDQLLSTAISTDQLAEISQLLRAKHVFFVMDACYSGLIFARATPISSEALDYLEIVTTRKARKALTAGGRDQTVMDTGPGGHSVFTYYLLDALKNKTADLNRDGIITTGELNDYVSPRVTSESRRTQTPEYGILSGDLGGDFVFIPVKAVKFANLTISVEPEDATIYIDGIKVDGSGTYRLTLDKHTIKVTRDGYKDYISEIELFSDDYLEVNLTPLAAVVEIKSNVKDAYISVDGVRVGALQNGYAKINVQAGVRNITLENEEKGYEASSKIVELELGKTYSLYFELKLKPSFIEIKSNVPDADVYIDDIKVGKLSQGSGVFSVSPGRRKIKLEHPDYESVYKYIDILPNSRTKANLNLEPSFYNITIQSNVEDAVVWIDDVRIGNLKNGILDVKVRKGFRSIKLSKEGYKTATLSRNIKNNERIDINLEQIFGTLKLNVSPVPSKIDVYVDDEHIGVLSSSSPYALKIQATLKIPYGSHKVKLTSPGFKPYEFEVFVQSEKELYKDVVLSETPETIAMRIYKSKVSTLKSATVTSGLLSVGFFGAAYIFHVNAEKSYRDYLQATRPSDMKDYYNKYKELAYKRNISIGLGSGFAIATVYFLLKKVDYNEIYRDVLKKHASINFINSGGIKAVSISITF